MLAPNDKLVICFAHVAYRLDERFSVLNTGIKSFAVRDAETLENRVGEADVLVISGLGMTVCSTARRSSALSRRSAPAPTSSRAASWQSAASALPARAASTTAQSLSTRWPSSSL